VSLRGGACLSGDCLLPLLGSAVGIYGIWGDVEAVEKFLKHKGGHCQGLVERIR